MDEELGEEDRKNRKDRMGFDVVLEPPRHDQVIYLTESNLLYIYYWPAHPDDPRGLEWPQVLNSLSVCLSVCLFSDCSHKIL